MRSPALHKGSIHVLDSVFLGQCTVGPVGRFIQSGGKEGNSTHGVRARILGVIRSPYRIRTKQPPPLEYCTIHRCFDHAYYRIAPESKKRCRGERGGRSTGNTGTVHRILCTCTLSRSTSTGPSSIILHTGTALPVVQSIAPAKHTRQKSPIGDRDSTFKYTCTECTVRRC